MNGLTAPGGMGGIPQAMDAQALQAATLTQRNAQHAQLAPQSQLRLSGDAGQALETRLQGRSVPGLGEHLNLMV
ncbi:MAG: hypothetical protein LDL30_07700 [Desulfovibrio sp.]|nr:hypothetical protein [Desulfovibrio sp.]